jgi:BON domain-containing protein
MFRACALQQVTYRTGCGAAATVQLNEETLMPFDKTICAAIATLALTAACGRDETRTSTAPPPAPTIAQPTERITGLQGAAATSDAESPAVQTVRDANVTVKVKAALLDAPEVKGTLVNVDTVNGIVTLKGEVETLTQADRAVQIARNTEGVKQVENQLMVKARS